MSLKEKIQEDLLNAKKRADVNLVAILKLLWSEIGYLAVDKKDNDEGIVSMLKKESRKRNDSIEIYKKAGDKKRTEDEEYELVIIKGYLPEEMGEDEIKKAVLETREESGLSGGQLVGVVMKKLAGKADGRLVARIVTEL